jgi:zinc protease
MNWRLAALLCAAEFFCGMAMAANVVALPVVPGAQVWFVEDHTVPMVALTASFPAGSAYDPSSKTGIAAFAAALLDEGASDLGSDAFQAALAARAIHLSAEPTHDVTTVTLITLSSNAKEAFRLLALALSRPRFDPEAIERVRAQIQQDIAEGDEDPETVAEKGFYSLYFGPYTYGRPVDGEMHALQAITRNDLVAFAHTHWVRGGLKIAVAGDTDKKTLTTFLRSTFGSLPADEPPLPHAPLRVGAPGIHILPMEVPQPAIVFGLPGLKRSDPDYVNALVANYILGGGESSRLSTQLREKRGLTYEVSTELVPYRLAGLIVGHVVTQREAVRQAISIVHDTIRRFATDGPTDSELTDAKTYLNGELPLSFASDTDTAAELNVIEREGLPLSYLDTRADQINAVTADDVRRVAGRLFSPSKLTVVVAGTLPAEAAGPPISP